MVIDEPFYAAYLDQTGIDHPMREQVLLGERDPQRVVDRLLGSVETGVFYQKHMLQHMVDGMPRDWINSVINVFLIRDPLRVLASYGVKRETVSYEDLGFRQQAELFDAQANPIVLDASDILTDPQGMLTKLCDALGILFEPAMLSWPKGPHKDDGVWGAHWYESIWASTGFVAPKSEPRPNIDRPNILDPAMELYSRMYAVRL